MVVSLSRENESAENQTLSNKSKDLSVLTEQLKGSALQALENINFSPIPSIEGGGEQRRISETINGLQVNVVESINNPRYPSLDVEVIDNSLAIDSLNSRSLLLRTNPQGEVNYALPDDDIYSRIGLDKNEFAELVITSLNEISTKNNETLAIEQSLVSTTPIIDEPVKALEVEIDNSVTLAGENRTTELTQETLLANSLPVVTENSGTDLLLEVSPPIAAQSEQVEPVQATSVTIASANTWVESLKSQIDNIDGSKVQIFSGSSKAYEQTDNVVTLDKLETPLGEKVQQALENPNELKGSVRIVVDGEKIYHAKDGEVPENKYSLTLEKVTQEKSLGIVPEVSQVVEAHEQNLQVPLPTPEPNQSISPIQAEVSFVPPPEIVVTVKNEQIKSSLLQAAQPISLDSKEKAVFELIARQDARINQLEQKLATQTKPLNVRVNQWLGAINQTAKEAVQQVKQKSLHIPQNVRSFIANKANEIQNSISEQVKTTRTHVVNKVNESVTAARTEVIGKVNEVKSSLERQLADVAGKSLNASTRYLAERFGVDNGSGIKVFQGNSLVITSSVEHSGIYSKDGKQLVKDGQFVAPVTSEQLSKIAQIQPEAQKLSQSQSQSQSTVRAKALR